MPVEFDILEDLDLTCIRLLGRVNLSEILEYLIDYKADPSFRPGLNEFLDLSGWTDTDMGYMEMRRLRYAERILYPAGQSKVRCSIFAPNDFQYGMARIYVSLTDVAGDVNSQVFEDLDGALSYLNLDNSETPACIQKGTSHNIFSKVV